ncbi:conserved hypothetical protein [Nostocoides japonicum T1-X7]|uniref:Uncharacterized protein n=1 Tax=Nostocoides japonicum T1-X7 TaxID=1194083 RepID=A0A077M8L9_9MICO|nr:hypothetical protein [Tetrasphaera japonica]CCH80394.1 conserved hypothetical protein [Tetrasphaera japonica T1-X7]
MVETVGETISTGAYWDPDTWQLARAAYVADLDNDPDAPGAFIGWIHRAIEQHVARGVRGRARLRLEELAPAGGGRRGFNRHHPLRADTRAALELAIVEDRRGSGVPLSRSGFLREAVLAAIDASRRRAGDELTPIPGRLPNHPVRS